MPNSWNPADKAGTVTLTSGNLNAGVGGIGWVRSLYRRLAGANKIYWEVKPTNWSNGNTLHGFCPGSVVTPSGAAPTGLCGVYPSGNIWLNNANTGSTLGVRASNDVIGIALDTAAKLAWLRVCPSGNWNGSGTANPATGTGGINVASILSVDAYALVAFGGGADQVVANFGGTFIGAIPSGFARFDTVSPVLRRQVMVV